MLATVAAVIFGIALVLDITGTSLGEPLTNSTLITAGLLCLALHLAGFSSGRRWRVGR